MDIDALVSPENRRNIFPVLETLVSELRKTGLQEMEILQTMSVFTYERIHDVLVQTSSPEQVEMIIQAMNERKK